MSKVNYLFQKRKELDKGWEDLENAKLEYFEIFGSTNKTRIDDFNRRKNEKENFIRKNYNMTVEEYLNHSEKTITEKMKKYEENK